MKKKQKVSYSYFPDDLLYEIFPRLPAKSIGRFRCISKFWCQWLSSNDFIYKHINESKQNNEEQNLQILIFTEHYGLYELYLLPYYNHQDNKDIALDLNYPVRTFRTSKVWVLGSCNGIICLMYPKTSLICLWNPCTRDYKMLWNSEIIKRYEPWMFHTCGFGYNPVVNDYEILRIAYIFRDRHRYSIAYVYSLTKDSYRIIMKIPYQICHNSKSGQLVNGALHWLGSHSGTIRWIDDDSEDEYRLVLAFDIGGEQFREVPQPDYGVDEGHKINISEFRGQLCICCWYDEQIDFWVMKEYNVRESWVKLFHVKHNACKNIDYYIPLHYTKNGSTLFYMGDDLVIYDSITKARVTYLTIGGHNRFIHGTTYMESLVRLER
ncbi:hypothetical protein AQUCO_05900025v1 [Aquilegia coerulea]|uniref:F-box domain-containing protein n=1 Tax=Aquilegia coerulea TaxID=218851 RepID=A0A2G5CE36_AQUCA|nr:hypothetical protein AQUCO_05900025v1 [Aquilegia coerulea]